MDVQTAKEIGVPGQEENRETGAGWIF